MAKKKSDVTKRAKRDAIGAVDFLKVYVPLAREGKSAKEIGAALGRDATFVLVKASQLRKSIRDGEGDEAVKAARLAKVPELKRGGGKVMNALDALEL